jgi:uncharacterized membrane protein
MEKEGLMYTSIFTLFVGFLIFIFTILNQRFNYAQILIDYFMLFILSGIVFSIIGTILMLIWYVENRQPFQEQVTRDHFPSFFAIGALLIITGVVVFTYYGDLNKGVFYMSLSLSIAGIFILIMGLNYFVREVIFSSIKKNVSQHS